MSILDNLNQVKKTIPNKVKLVAVSKTKPNELILEAYNAGQKVFGENRPQDLQRKFEDLPKDIEWHFIGHPQSKQVKYFAAFVHFVHGVDSLKLLSVINKEALKNKRIINCLLQFHIASEETKFGLSLSEVKELLESEEFKLLDNVAICGVMGMATFTDDEDRIRKEFKELKSIFSTLKKEFFKNDPDFKEISMGMSADYHIAIEEGSTMVRVGSLIFGARKYS